MRRPLLVLLPLLAVLAMLTNGAGAATPAQQPATVPTQPGQVVTVTWTGTVPPSATRNPLGEPCDERPDAEVDRHRIQLAVPPGAYDTVRVTAEYKIEWTPVARNDTSDEILTVVDTAVPKGDTPDEGEGREVGTSDGGQPREIVVDTNPRQSTYEAQACGFVNTQPQPYRGTLTLTATALEPPVPSVDAQGLAFGAAIAADPQRDESEPNIEVDKDGRIYTCGPSGVSQGVDYAQVSTDGGAQFHPMGTRPRAQHAIGGGGDCSLSTSFTRNATGTFDYAATGLGPLTNFSTAASADGGRTIRSAQTGTVPGVDRQWQTWVDANTVLLNYNGLAPRQVVVQRSTDKGVTYSAEQIAATPTNPSFPGPMRTIEPGQSPTGKAIAYFPWNRGRQINLSISQDGGRTWSMCKVAEAPGDPALFVTADHDREGNVYLAFSEDATFHTYMTSLPRGAVTGCKDPVNPTRGQQTAQPVTNPGWAPLTQVDRDAVRTTVFGWLTAGGEPGRVAIAFYGTEGDGNPNTGAFRGSWDVYVNQTLDGLRGADVPFSQVKATTHPFHYDSICLEGLGCDVVGGDRSLADFFAIDFNPKDGTLHVVFNQGYKRPGDAAGSLATPAVVSQVAGPSLGGGTVSSGLPTVRSSTDDPTGDAFGEYSRTTPPPGSTPPDTKVPAMDVTSVAVGPEVDPEKGTAVERGGFTVRMKVADLSDAALQAALPATGAQELLYVFRFVNGFRSSAAVARWSRAEGFAFGFNGFRVASAECGSSGEKCLQYPGDEPIAGRVDQKTGEIVLSVPRSKLRALGGSTSGASRPTEVVAEPGDRLYDAGVFTLANPQAPGAPQSFLYPVDNTAGMDFLVPGARAEGGTAGAGAAGGGAGAGAGAPAAGGTTTGASQRSAERCTVSRGFTSVDISRAGRGLQLKFAKRVAARADVDVFQVAAGGRVIGERLVARFADRSRSFRWNGRANRRGQRVRDGVLFVRFRVDAGGGRTDTRRIALRRVRGRFFAAPSFYGRSSCSLIPSFKLERPVFGGRTNREASLSFRVAERSRVTVTVLRAGRVVRRFPVRIRQSGVTHRLRFDSEKRPRGLYRFVVSARPADGGATVTRTLTARRL